jgi:hypothetical protein
MQPAFPLTLRSRATNQAVAATLTLDISQSHLRAHTEQWRPLLGWFPPPGGDADWDWSALIAEERALAPTATWLFAVEADGLLQGLMIAQNGASYVANLDGQQLLYVSYVATAPWNRSGFRRGAYTKRIVPEALAGVGEALIIAAIAKSRELGLDGRIGLHSLLPALDFYLRNCHFTFVGKHARSQESGTFWCELPAVSATFLERGRVTPIRRRKP